MTNLPAWTPLVLFVIAFLISYDRSIVTRVLLITCGGLVAIISEVAVDSSKYGNPSKYIPEALGLDVQAAAIAFVVGMLIALVFRLARR